MQEQFYKSLRGGADTRNNSKKSTKENPEPKYMSKNRKKKQSNIKNQKGLLNTDLLDLSDEGDRGNKSIGSNLETRSFTNDQ